MTDTAMSASEMARKAHASRRAKLGEEGFKEAMRAAASRPRPNAQGKKKPRKAAQPES